jgi:hypothetical protein
VLQGAGLVFKLNGFAGGQFQVIGVYINHIIGVVQAHYNAIVILAYYFKLTGFGGELAGVAYFYYLCSSKKYKRSIKEYEREPHLPKTTKQEQRDKKQDVKGKGQNAKKQRAKGKAENLLAARL